VVNANFREYYREDRNPIEYDRVREIAHSLLSYLTTSEVIEKIARVNVKNVHSREVQQCILDHATGLGFHDEKEGLFAGYEFLLRPDYYLSLSPGRGILLEIEKGRTLENNNDLLDLWKCHICTDAQYLFLIVPMQPVNTGERNVFSKVVKRMQPFFLRENYVGVYGLFIYGY
jgi:hypothetical protein